MALDSVYTEALKIATSSGVLVSHLRPTPDEEEKYAVWDNDVSFLEAYSDAWLEHQYTRLNPLYPDVPLETYVWILVDVWDERDEEGQPTIEHALYDTLEDALPSINVFFKSHGHREYATVEQLQSDRMFRVESDKRLLVSQAEEVNRLGEIQSTLEALVPYDSTPLVLSSEQYTLNFRIKHGWDVVQRAATSSVMPWILSTSVPGVDAPVLRTVDNVPASALSLLPRPPLAPMHIWVAIKTQKGNYIVLVMDVAQGVCDVEIPFGIDVFAHQLTTMLPGITWGTPRRISVRGEYVLRNMSLSEFALAELVTSDRIMSSYLTLNENDPPPIRGRARIGALWNKSRFILYFKQLQSKEKALHALFNQSVAGAVNPYGMVSGTPYVSVSILKGPSDESVKLFYEIFNRLMTYYTARAPDVLSEYAALLGVGQTGKLSVRKSERLARQEDNLTRNDRLKMALPEVFVNGYARICQAQFQPEVLEDGDEAPAGRQVLRFPAPPNDKLQLVCPDNSAPFPTLIQNTLSSQDVVGYLPCCTTKNQIDDNPTSAYTKIYIDGKEVAEAFPPTKTRITIQNDERILDYNRSGDLNRIIYSIVQSTSATRLGSHASPSSFLVSMLQAVGAAPDVITTAYVEEQRRILSLPYPELLSQELWDMSLSERVAWFRDPNRYLDPQVFLRALENALDVNIYLFGVEDGVPVILLPRFCMFPCRTFRARRCALIYVHTEAQRCELIIDGDKRLWGEDTNLRLYSLQDQLCPTDMRTSTGTVTDAQNVYRWHEHIEDATHQIIDAYGKLQGLVFETYGLTLRGPPGTPLSLPAWPSSAPYPQDGSENDVIALMKRQPTRRMAHRLEYNYPKGVCMVWHVGHAVSSFDKVAHQQVTVTLIVQCANILYYLSVQGELSDDTVEPWVHKACVVRPADYDPASMPTPYLPSFETEADARTYLSTHMPSFFDNDRLLLPSNVFKKRLESHLRRFVKIYGGQKTRTPNMLVGVPLRLDEPSARLYVGAEVDQVRLKTLPKDAEMVTALTPEHLNRAVPVSMRVDKALFIVLPKQPDIDTALVIADNWRTSGRVIALAFRPIPTSYVLLELTESRSWTVKDRIGDDPSTLMVLTYGREGIAAVLPL